MEFPILGSPGKGVPEPHGPQPASERGRRRLGSFPPKTFALQAFQEAGGWFLLLCFPKPLVSLHALHPRSVCTASPKMPPRVWGLFVQELLKWVRIFCVGGFGWNVRASFGRVFVLTSLHLPAGGQPGLLHGLLHAAPPPFPITSHGQPQLLQGEEEGPQP